MPRHWLPHPVMVASGCADECDVTIHGFDGDVSVEDRTAECLTAIARTYEEGMAHLAFLARLWEAPAVKAVPALPTMRPVPVEAAEPTVQAEPVTPVVVAEPVAPVLLAEEPAMLPMTPVAVDVVATPVGVPVAVAPDAPTAVELPVAEPVTELIDTPDPATELIDTPAQDGEPVHVLFAEAVTDEIPVQAAA